MIHARWAMAVVVVATSAFAQSFAGSWTSEAGSMSLKQQGARVTGTATVAGVSGTLTGVLKGASFGGTYTAQGESGTFNGHLDGDTLYVSFDDSPLYPFRRAGAAAPPPVKNEPAPKVSAADGAELRSDAEGWSARAPAKWKFKTDGVKVLFGSDTEAGMIIASFRQGATVQEMQQAATQGFSDSGLMLTPAGPPQELDVKGAKAIAVDMQTTAQDGTALKVRAAGVIGGGQGGVAILGLTTPEKFATLRARVDQLAKSVAFFAPKLPPGTNLLRGSLCSYSGGSVASFTTRYNFDGRGRVSKGSEMIAGGQFNDGMGNNTGSWSAVSGNQYNADNVGTYAVQGNSVVIRLGGDTYTCAVHFRQQSGQITEMKCGDRLYGTSLCE